MGWFAKRRRRIEETMYGVRDYLISNGPSHVGEIHHHFESYPEPPSDVIVYRAICAGREAQLIGRMVIDEITYNQNLPPILQHSDWYARAMQAKAEGLHIQGIYYAIDDPHFYEGPGPAHSLSRPEQVAVSNTVIMRQ
jgi:alkanesulfonate monooxygenase SsuD/methylene tetrahydromethanopterin reductase-like flavin-dependent oxidoreductase (luciferase family)